MSQTPPCNCPQPRPKVTGVGQVVCQECGGSVEAKKKDEAAPNYVNITDDELVKRTHDLERRQRQLQLDIQALKRDLTARAASREQPSR